MAVLPLELEGDLPEGFIPLEVVSVIKCLDESGEPALCIRQSGGVTEWEIIGMLETARAAATDNLVSEFNHKRREDDP